MKKAGKTLIPLLLFCCTNLTACSLIQRFTGAGESTDSETASKSDQKTSALTDSLSDKETDRQDANPSASETGEQTNDFSSRVENYLQQYPQLDRDDAELCVAMNLDLEPYTGIQVIDNPDSITVLVNKYNALPDGYVPYDLQEVPSSGEHGSVYMRQEAADAFTALVQAAAQQSIILNACSTFRSQEAQAQLWENGAAAYGTAYADLYWTRPGHSEHQTGLAVDIRLFNDLSDLDAVRSYPQAYQWLLDNMADYGFILRYPEGKSDVTLIAPESWHLRYVGVDLAQFLTMNNLTMEEYCGLLQLSS